MRSKRFLSMLLALSLVLSLMAPAAAFATTAGDDSFIVSDKKTEASEENNTAARDNDLILSGKEAVTEQKNLRDDPIMIPVVKTPEVDTTKNGHWNSSESAIVPSASLTMEKLPDCIQELQKAAEVFDKSERVTAFVVLEAAPLAERYSSIAQVIASEEQEMLGLQDSVISEIERTLLKGEKLEVRYQFTYLTNAFTIATEFQNLEKIARMKNVKSVFVMPVYDAIPSQVANPNTDSAGEFTGVHSVWQELGYTGKGMKIAVIDTGLDLDHPSFAAEPETTDTSLTIADIDAVLKDLNAYAKRNSITGKTLYRSAKVPFAFNYVDNSLTADHSQDIQGDHGTHVAGIAAANKLDSTPVVGMAPDAQIIVMKVFGAAGGAYTDDIVAALEDAMTLGCDVVNLSLGSPAGFTSSDTEIDLIYERLASQDIIATISAGNEGTSAYDNMWGTNKNRTNNPDNATVGSPGIYANATTIASAENTQVMTPFFALGDGTTVFFNNDTYGFYYGYTTGMAPLVDEELEYVVIDGLGNEEDYYDADGNSLVEGKVAVVSRGTINFGVKIINAEYAGAVACIIANNSEDDIFNFMMNDSLTAEDGSQYYASIPTCLISKADREIMANAEVKTLTVSKAPAARENTNGGQMSSFSSWGAAPDLSLEPDLTGIGGNVYSCYDGGNYGLMSGTSMSAPQVAGTTALVMQHLYELYPNSPDGTIREMAEALLMSTADPIITEYGTEASPRQQGAGLVDALEATTTKAYLTVGGNAPKAELGDSATGNYTFSFEIHNFGTEEKTYLLHSSLLTEAAASAGSGLYFMYGVDIPLSGSVTFDKDTVTVPAGGRSNVKVTIELSEEDKAMFAEQWKNGGYVEGFVYLYTEAEDGMLVSELNLPFLGFYGDWTKAPVFDSGYWYQNGFWGLNSATGMPEAEEYYHVMWTDLAGTDWVLGMNPYSGAYLDATGRKVAYDPAHNVVSPNGDGVLDGITEIYLSLLRNAKTLTFTYTVGDEIVHRETVTNNSKTMYRSNYGQVIPWIYSWYGNGLYDFTDADGNVLPSGTELLLTIDATVDYGLGGNHSISLPITVDTTMPELYDVMPMQDENGKDVLAVLATDETALAAVVLMNPTGTQMLVQSYDVQMLDLGNGIKAALFDVEGLGTEFLVAICDYACNEAYYEISFVADDGNLPVMNTDALYAYRVFDQAIYSDHMYGWVSMMPPAAEDEEVPLTLLTDDYLEYAAINAAEYVDGKIFAVDAVYNLMVMDPGLFNRTTICNLGVNVIDMTFDDSTDTMYVLSKQGNYMYLYSMDLTTGALTKLKDYGYYTSSAPYAIADDDNGTIYAIRYNKANLYTVDVNNGYTLSEVKVTVDGVESNLVITDSDGDSVQPNYAQSITWKDGKLYWAYFMNYYNYYLFSDLITIDTETWESYAINYSCEAYDASNTLVAYQAPTELVGLLTLTETEYQIPEATELTDLVLSAEQLLLTVGQSDTVSASAMPWNYTLGEVIWTSSDESVATVSAGRITAVAEGKATITVATEGIEKTIEVQVIDTDTTFNAYNYYSGDDYYGYMIHVDTGIMDYYLDAESPVDWLSGDFNGHDGYFYGYTEGGQFWRYNQETGEVAKLGNPIGATPTDMAYDYSTGLMYAATVDYNMGYSTISVVDLNTGALEPVYQFEYQYFITLACDGEGNLYTVTAFGELYKIVMENGQPVDMLLVMEGFGDIQYMQSMCWDHAKDVLLWAYCEYGSIVWIDPNAEEPYALMLGDPTGSGLFEFVGMYTIPAEIPELDYVAVTEVVAQDMMMITGNTKSVNISVYPFNATVQTYSLTSDNACVTVNADGTLTAVSEGTANITGTLVDGENTFAISFRVTVVNGADEVYGMVLSDLATMGGQTWYRIYTQNPADPDVMEYTNYVIYAEEYYNGKLYAVGYDPDDWEGNWQYFVMNPANHAIEAQYDLGEGYPFVYDMTYDYATSTMYAVAGASDNDSNLYIFDIETGALVPLLTTEQFFMSMAAVGNGKLYAIENSKIIESEDSWDPWGSSAEETNATLYVIDPMAGTVELVGDTGVKANMLGSMSFDYDTGYLYWAALYQGMSNISGLYMIDTETGAATNLGAIGAAGAQVSGLYIISDNFPAEDEAALNKLLVAPEKASVSTGASVTVHAYTIPMSLDAQITWTSSNEKVATVDANGVVTGVKSGTAVITASVTYGGVTMTGSCNVSVLDADAAFLTYNITDGGWAQISRADGTVTNLTEGSEAAPMVAVASAGSAVYAYDAENNFYSVNAQTGETNLIGAADIEAAVAGWLADIGYGEEEIEAEKDYYTLEIRDMAYDKVNDRFLVLGACVDAEYGDEMYAGDAIYEVNLADGKLTQLYRFWDIYNVMAMTVGNDGTVYYYNAYNDYYTALDLADGTAKDLVSGQTQSFYGDYENSHALYFDELTGLVYHLFTSNGTLYRLLSVDPETAMLNQVFESLAFDWDLFEGHSFAGLTYVKKVVKLADPVVTASNDAKSGKIQLSWEEVDGAVAYEVLRSTDKENYEPVATVTEASYFDRNTEANTRYYYKVRTIAEDAESNSDYSKVVSRLCDLAKPEITLTNIESSGKVKVSWEPVEGAKMYRLYVSTDNENWTKLITTYGTYVKHVSGEAGVRYYYKVRAVAENSYANSAYSDVKNRICDLARPVITLSNIESSGKIKITWDAVEGAVKYQVYVSTNNKNWTSLTTTSGTTVNHTGAEAGTRYYYKVRAIAANSNANSAFSTVKSRMCDLACPVLKVTLNSKGKPYLTWNAVEDAVKYRVYVSTDGETWTTLITTTKTAVTNTSAVAGKTYYYKVRAVAEDTVANSACSVVKSVTAK